MLYNYAQNVCNEFRLPDDPFDREAFLAKLTKTAFLIFFGYLALFIAAIAFFATTPASWVVIPIIILTGGFLLIYLLSDAIRLKAVTQQGDF